MFAGTALSVRLFIYAGLSLFIISGPYLYMVVCVLYAYNLTADLFPKRFVICSTLPIQHLSTNGINVERNSDANVSFVMIQ